MHVPDYDKDSDAGSNPDDPQYAFNNASDSDADDPEAVQDIEVDPDDPEEEPDELEEGEVVLGEGEDDLEEGEEDPEEGEEDPEEDEDEDMEEDESDPDDPEYDEELDSEDSNFVKDGTNSADGSVSSSGSKPVITSVFTTDSLDTIKEEPGEGFLASTIKVEASDDDSSEVLHLDSLNTFEVKVPLIGKPAFPLTTQRAFPHRYDLAKEGNRLKNLEVGNEAEKYISIKECKELHSGMTEVKFEDKDKIRAMPIASTLTKLAIRILAELAKGEGFDEDSVLKGFSEFRSIPVTYLSLVYSPHLVHTIMYVRGNDAFPDKVRKSAAECYWKCHALFPIPNGYNFQTVYASEVEKHGLQGMNGLEVCDLRRDYGDYDEDAPVPCNGAPIKVEDTSDS